VTTHRARYIQKEGAICIGKGNFSPCQSLLIRTSLIILGFGTTVTSFFLFYSIVSFFVYLLFIAFYSLLLLPEKENASYLSSLKVALRSLPSVNFPSTTTTTAPFLSELLRLVISRPHPSLQKACNSSPIFAAGLIRFIYALLALTTAASLVVDY
jgi:hypothetical protein